MAITQTATVSTSPTTAGIGTSAPADADVPGHAIWPLELRGREAEPDDGELGGAEREQDTEAEERGEEGDLVVGDRGDRDQAARREHDDRRERRGRDERAPAQPAERAGQHPVLAERVREAPEPGHGCRRGGQEDERAGDTDEDAQRVREERREILAEHLHDPEQRGEEPLAAEIGLAARHRERREADDGDRDVEDHDDADGAEEAAGDVDAGAASLLREVGHRLQAGVGEHRERQREREIGPARRRAQLDSARERVRREEQGEAEHDDEQLRHEVEHRDADAGRVEAGATEEAHGRDGENRRHADDDVPRVPLQRLDLERPAEVVRQEEHGERDDDEVVEEQHPAGAEAGEVVERLAHERGRAARLRNRGDALGVRQGDDDEEQPRQQQHLWRQPERVAGDDAEREVDRRRDLAVRDREQRGRAEDALQHGQLARHQLLPCLARSRYRRPAPRPTNSTPSR